MLPRAEQPLRQQPTRLEIAQWQARQHDMDLLRLITCGSVDDGKSTLIGRLLWESHQVFEDQWLALQSDSRRHGTQGDAPDLALLVDGLSVEREQGITIDVAYRHFATPRRRFILADTPGHEQYTRNMVTGASTADAAVLLVDARHGLLLQTYRHVSLVALMGLRQVVLAVNKMDLVDYRRQVFEDIREAFQQLPQAGRLGSVQAIPISALCGDNICRGSENTPWYEGPTLLSSLEQLDLSPVEHRRTVFPVQWVNRPHPDFRGLSGTLAEGRLQTGDTLRVTASGQTARIARIVTYEGDLPAAVAGQAITLVLDREVDASRGDVLARADQALDMTDRFEATLVWMHDEVGLPGRTYELKLGPQWAAASITRITQRLEVTTLLGSPCEQLALNDIAHCELSLSRPLVFDRYEASRSLGSFILVDRLSQATVALGMIRSNLRPSQNVHRQSLSIQRADRERLNGHAGRVLWLTGLSGSGKSTFANALEQRLHAQGLRTYILDGDNLRQGLNRDLGFSAADRVENIRRVAEVARLMLDAGLIVMTAFISPFRAERAMARQLIGEDRFLEIYMDTPLAICEARDPKGLYRKARAGALPDMTGIGSPYEVPESPDMVIRPDQDQAQQIRALCSLLERARREP